LLKAKRQKNGGKKISSFYIFASIFLPFSLLLAGRPCSSLTFGCGLTPCGLCALALVGTRVKVRVMFGVLRSGITAFAALMAILCFPLEAFASGVVTSATESSLVAAMSGGGTVTFAVNGTIYLTSTIVVSSNTVIDAPAITRRSAAVTRSKFLLSIPAQPWP
jgi:hypothetical protein